jgi:uncharacterized protein YjbI with pentapeptide repeats
LVGGVRGIDLRGFSFDHALLQLNLVDCDLRDASFNWATVAASITGRLGGTSFIRSRLHGAYFAFQHLDRVSFASSTITKASFEGASLRACCFQGTACKEVIFDRADLRFADFRGSSWTDCFLREAVLDSSTDLRSVQLLNLFHSDQLDRSGRLFRKGTDWRLALTDDTTTYRFEGT